ncbi:MAG: general stress protein [Planococcus donghaensis]
MKSGNQEFEIVYSKSEMEEMLQVLKAKGYQKRDIHVLANDKEIIESAGKSGVSADQANSFSNRFKSFISGKDIVRKELDRFNLSKERTDDYERAIEKGAVLLYTDGDAATPEDEHFSSLDDSNAPMDLEAETAGTADSHAVSRHQEKQHASDEIYAREVSREDQHARAAEHDRFQDSRLKGDEIHPTGGLNKEERAGQRKDMEHEPGLQNGDNKDELLREKGVNRREDEPSPGVDPNLGPAPFGRDVEETGNEQRTNPDEYRDVKHKRDSDNTTPPTPRLF